MHTTIVATNFSLRFNSEKINPIISCEWEISGRETLRIPNGHVIKSPPYTSDDEVTNVIKTIAFVTSKECQSSLSFFESDEYHDSRLMIEVCVSEEFVAQLMRAIQFNLVGTFDIDFDATEMEYGSDRRGRDLIMNTTKVKVCGVSADFSQKHNCFTLQENFHLRDDYIEQKKFEKVKKYIYKEIGKNNGYLLVIFFAIAYAFFKHV